MSSRHAAIVLAAGSGTRMHSDIPQQYLDLRGKPVLYYSLKALEESFVDDIVLVTGVGVAGVLPNEIVKKYGLKKVRSIVPAEHSGMIPYTGGCVRQKGRTIFISMMEPGRS